MCKQLSRSILFTFYHFGSILLPFWNFFFVNTGTSSETVTVSEVLLPSIFFTIFGILFVMFIQFIRVNKNTFYVYRPDCIWPFTTFISRNKHKKNIRLRLYWLRLRVAEAEVQTSHAGSVVSA